MSLSDEDGTASVMVALVGSKLTQVVAHLRLRIFERGCRTGAGTGRVVDMAARLREDGSGTEG